MSPNVVVVGSGSAGRRHAGALRRRLPEAELFVVRRPESHQPVEFFETIRARLVPSLDDVLDTAPTVAVVAGPATHHRVATEQLLVAGAHVLVEKPMAAIVSDGRAMSVAAGRSGRDLIVGYHLRCAETVRTLRLLIDRNVIGRPTGFHFAVGQHLGDWRLGVDPAASVSARDELGGGVLLELSHELDGVLFLLGPVRGIDARLRTDGAPTDGIVDTVADLDVELRSGVTGTVHLDMISERPTRTWEIRGTSGVLRADLLAGRITLGHDGRVEQVHRSAPDERDRAESALIDNLVDVSAGVADPICSASDGIAALVLVEAAKDSARRGRSVSILAGGSGTTDERAGATR